ncbi:MAG: hypothetical protein GY754_20430 [bacterium]|nr:hypothetical protein [bacterium]
MLDKILQFTREGFYQEKSELIGNAVKKYGDARADASLTPEEVSGVRSDSETILRDVMIENGFRDEDSAFISMDKEFFSEDVLDPKKLSKFQKEMLLNYGSQQVKWTFSGTTAAYSPITKRVISKEGGSYSNLLPAELKRKNEKEEKEKLIQNKDSDFHIYLYADGTTSDSFIKEKAPFSMDKLNDKSGFNWDKGYAPDNTVNKKGWIAGFNNDNEWERMAVADKPSVISSKNAASPTMTFSDRYREDDNAVSFIVNPENNEVFLFDHFSQLKNGKEERFYSITGELYGSRGIDKEASIDGIKNYLSKNEITRLAGIIVDKTNEETVEYYKENFNEFVTEQTEFLGARDKELKEKLVSLKNDIANKEVSKNILSGFFELSQQGRKGEELYDALTPSVVKSEYEVNLNIFDSKEDLNTFAAMPHIKEVLDDESTAYIANLDVPQEKREQFSNVTQNIVNNYDNIFKEANMDKKELLKSSYDIVVNETPGSAGSINIVKEKNLSDFILDSARPSRKPDIPSFTAAFKKKDEYFDISDSRQFDLWAYGEIKTNALPAQTAANINQVITVSDIPADRKKQFAEDLRKTSIPEQTLSEMKELIAKADIPPFEKKDLSAKIDVVSVQQEKLESFAAQKQDKGLLQTQNIPGEVIAKIKEIILDMSVPETQKDEYSRAIQNTFEQFTSISMSTGMPAPELAEIVGEIIVHNKIDPKAASKRIFFEKDLASLIIESTKENSNKAIVAKEDVYVGKQADPSAKKLDLLNDTDINIFAISPFMRTKGLNEEEAQEVVSYLKEVSVPSNKADDFSRGVTQVITAYKEKIEPLGVSPVEAVRSVTKALTGQIADIPQAIESIVYSGIGKKKGPDAQKGYATPLASRGIGTGFTPPLSSNGFELNLAQHTDLNSFAASSYLVNAGLSKDQSSQVISFLEQAIIPASKGVDFSRSVARVISSYTEKIAPKGISPVQAIRSVEAAFNERFDEIPAAIEPIISAALTSTSGTAVETSTALISPEGFELNISKEDDLNTFAVSTFMNSFKTENNLSDGDSEEIISLIKNAPVPSEKGVDFSRAVARTLAAYNNDFASLNTTPVKVVQAVADAIAGNIHRIPEKIKDLVLSNAGIQPAVPEAAQTPEDQEPASIKEPATLESLDLFNENDLASFIKSPEFKNSEMSKENLQDLIREHSDSYQGLQNNFFKQIPLKFKSETPVETPKAQNDAPVESASNELPNDVYSTGWATTQIGDGAVQLSFTDFGKKELDPVTQQRVQQGSAKPQARVYNFEKIKESKESSQAPAIQGEASANSPVQPEKPAAAQTLRIAGDGDNMVFSSPFVTSATDEIKGAAGAANQNPNEIVVETTAPQQPGAVSPESERMMRIEQNYQADKKMLAGSGTSLDVTQKLAKGEGGKGGGGDKPGGDGNTVKIAFDELFDEFKRRIESNLS